MNDQESVAGFAHLTKTALPIIGRVGTVVGGIVSLLVVLEQISGQVITAVTGFVLIAAVVASAIVAFHRTTRLVDEKKIHIYSYSRRARLIAAIVMSIAGVFLIVFALQAGPNLFGIRRPVIGNRNPQGQSALSQVTRAAEKIDRAATVVSALTAVPTLPNRPTNSPPSTAALDQLTDVNLLLQLGNTALDQKRYGQAVGIFNRAIQVEATNALAQFGLGQAYFYLANYNAAQEPLQNALRLNVSLHDAHAFLGWIYDYRQDKAKAIAEYDAFLKAAAKDDPLRQEISDRQKMLTSATPAPSLTPRPTSPPYQPTLPPATVPK